MIFLSGNFLMGCTLTGALLFLAGILSEYWHLSFAARFFMLISAGLGPLFFYHGMALCHHRKNARLLARKERRIRRWLTSMRQQEKGLLAGNHALLLTGPDGRIQKASPAAIRAVGKNPSGSFISQFPGIRPDLQGHTISTHGKTTLCWIPLSIFGRKWRLGLDISDYAEKEVRLNTENAQYRKLAEHKSDELMIIRRRFQELSQLATLGRITAGISHDFNNILSSILGASQLAAMTEDEKRKAHHLNTIVTAGHRAKDLIQQILDFSRPDGKGFHTFSLKPLITESLRLIGASLPAHIVVRCQNEASDACIHGNPTRLHQLLINLMTNACHAMEDNGGILHLSIERCTKESVQWVGICVKDSGHGISEDIHQRIFEPFFTTRANREGHGMGLTLVREVVEEHGGLLTVESSPGTGALFRVELPHAGIKAGNSQTMEQPICHGKGFVLLVEDDGSLLTIVKEMIGSLGYGVHAVPNAAEALAWLSENSFADMILMDYGMPGMNGLTLASQIRERYPHLTILLTTGCPHWIRDKKIPHFILEKPFSMQELSYTLIQAGNQKPALLHAG
ncbi:ATP-binding protein [Desulfobotulus sp. H1]|uniref:histidine kinase n=1 Tax=Desulfobotulus pelophilus TaxID=2823377 RepID=A0ABT3N7U3_9BACT|nr:ATP-binding protein [Desulfobotulus pelophilus]MCW7753524.1 ATP-binding protein [Desulfobotulus pelophilus]